MNNIPGKESKSQLAYRLESEAEAAFKALKTSTQKTARDIRQTGRNAHSSTETASLSIVTDTTSFNMSTVQEQLDAAMIKINQLKEVWRKTNFNRL